MYLVGKLRKDGNWWLAEIPALDYLTQGKTQKEALAMAEDIIQTGADSKGFKAAAGSVKGGNFQIFVNDTSVLTGLMLQRLRQKHGLTVRDAAKNLGSKSPNAFAAYERGTSPSLEKLEQLIRAATGSPRSMKSLGVLIGF